MYGKVIAVLIPLAVVGVVLAQAAEEAKPGAPRPDATAKEKFPESERVNKTDAEWRKQLTPEQYHILREKGTDRPYTNAFWNQHTPGTYSCAACGLPLFNADKKFDSGCGWPSFFQPVEEKNIAYHEDKTLGMERTEILCARCGGHLGHVFDDGPKPTGLRYCLNSTSMTFKPSAPEAKAPGTKAPAVTPESKPAASAPAQP